MPAGLKGGHSVGKSAPGTPVKHATDTNLALPSGQEGAATLDRRQETTDGVEWRGDRLLIISAG